MADIFNKKNLLPAAPILILLVIGIIFKNNIRCIYWAVVYDTHCVSKPEPEEVTFFSDSLRIYGDIFTTCSTNSPVVILLHGSSDEGRKAALIQMLGKEFSESGYFVLAIDLRGFGESEGPETLSVENFDFSKDVTGAIDYLVRNASEFKIDTSRIFLIGHSFGGGVALSTLEKENRYKKLVLIGPSRRLEERFFSENATDKEYLLSKWEKSLKNKYKLDYEIWKNVYMKHDIQRKVQILNERKDLPVFLIDGEKEDKRDLEFLRKIVSEISRPVEYWTIPVSHHYLEVRYQKGELIYYGDALNLFIERVNEWLNN
jgi:pimeloyl-ACP methyl ester carboxylesterase